MYPPELSRPKFSIDQAALTFRCIPPAILLAAVLDIDQEAARWLHRIASRMPRGQGVTWLNDIKMALGLGFPFNLVMVAATNLASHGLIYKRRGDEHGKD